MNYCARCGSLLAPRRVSNGVADQWLCTNPLCGRVYYSNARPCAGVLIEQNNRVLLVRRAIEPFLGCWDIPGGFLEEREHPVLGALREAREETGLEIELTRLLGIFLDDYAGHNLTTFNVYYRARVIGGELAAADDAADARWFDPDDLPSIIAFTGHIPQVLATWRASLAADPNPDPAADPTLPPHLPVPQP